MKSSRTRDRTLSLALAGRFLPTAPPGKSGGGSYSRKQRNCKQVRTVYGEDSINALGGSLSRSDESDLGIKGDGIKTL